MVMIPEALGAKNDRAGEGQQQLNLADWCVVN
jgi:hypothetical protein